MQYGPCPARESAGALPVEHKLPMYIKGVFSYKATKFVNPSLDRLCRIKQTSVPAAAAQNDCVVSNVGSAILKQTFAALGLNG